MSENTLSLTCAECAHEFELPVVHVDYNVAKREGTYDHKCPACGHVGPCAVK